MELQAGNLFFITRRTPNAIVLGDFIRITPDSYFNSLSEKVEKSIYQQNGCII